MRIQYRKQFVKQFAKLPPKIQKQFYQRLDLFLQNKFEPVLNNHSVGRAFPGCYSINITGDYRAVFFESSDVAIFVKIGTHSELYG